MGTLHAHRRSTAQEVFVVGPDSRHAEKPQGPLSAILTADRVGTHLGCFASSVFHHHLVPSFSLFAVSCAHVSSTYARSSELEPGLPTGRSRPRALGTLAGELYLLASRCCAPTTTRIVSGRTPPGVLTPHPSLRDNKINPDVPFSTRRGSRSNAIGKLRRGSTNGPQASRQA